MNLRKREDRRWINTVVIIMALSITAVGSCGATMCQCQKNEKHTTVTYTCEQIEEIPVIEHISTVQQDILQAKEIHTMKQEIKDEDTEAELNLIVQLVAAEAENQDLDGKRLVVDTVLNRVDSNQFPNTILEVLYQPAAFSSIDDGRFDRAAFEISEEDYQAVTMELSNRLDPYVIYFTAEGYSIYGTPAYKHGDHYFSYK